MSLESRIHIGTSGWSFDSWKNAFYPPEIKPEQTLEKYAETFRTVELNNSFYKLPDERTVRLWSDKTPDDFLFSCKASRYITHMKKLKDPREGIDNLTRAFEPFGNKLGPILFQLPPNWRVNVERLKAFLEELPSGRRYTFEFRDRSWLCDEVYDLLQTHGAALCFYDYKGFQSPEFPTGEFIYVRLHGPGEKAYTGSYDGRTLAGYARKFLAWAGEGRDVFCYLDNDDKSHAPFDACRLMKSIEKQQ